MPRGLFLLGFYFVDVDTATVKLHLTQSSFYETIRNVDGEGFLRRKLMMSSDIQRER